MKQASDGRRALGLHRSVEAEVVDMRRDEIDLRLKIVAEAADSRPALLRPRIRDTAQLAGFEAAGVKLRSEIGVQCGVEVVLELAVQ